MTAEILTFPRPFAKPRPVLTVPTSDRVVRAWAEFSAANVAATMNPRPHNIAARDNAKARWLAAIIENGEPA